MINQFTTLTPPDIVSTGGTNPTQDICPHTDIKFYDGNNTAGLAVCLNCGALVGGL
jgi:hypothetical protein